ncbi:MAG TPA: hypothetical protein PK306_28605 [Aquabacterium sp.]|nr:hypothetical protein [Aquabacterium sp.]HQC99675.1 hypothetical protein [Aquabacterium sp.]
MDARLGWALAVVAVALGWVQYGWRGVVLALSVVVFWLLLQFTRALRAMRTAGGAPVGRVASAVMLQAKLKPRLRLMDVIQLTQSLGEKLADEAPGQPETFRWTDDSGASVTLRLKGGRVVDWDFSRPAVDEPPTAA